MRVLFALPGLHRYSRGAEIAFISIANELARAGDSVTLIGAGRPCNETAYRFLLAPCLGREHFEHFPRLPLLRNEWAYEELTFIPGLLWQFQPADYDVTLGCSYPFTNWLLRRPIWRGRKLPHVFVTENGDWPAYANNSEYRWFKCDGLICTNPDFYERNKARWNCTIIPNGVDCDRFCPSVPRASDFGLPTDRLIILMVSALIETKGVEIGIRAVSLLPDAYMVVAGDGPLRNSIDALAEKLLPNRFRRLSLPPERMPQLYQSANVFLHLSQDESFGNVFLEALATGLPVVAHDSPRVRWIVGDGQFLGDAGDPAAMARLLELASRAPSSQRQAGIARAATFSWSKVGAMYRKFLRTIVTNSSKP
jgi:glycosyltransferase involved in cell wall biosynthesis